MQPTSDFSQRTINGISRNTLNTYFMVFWIGLIAGFLLILPWGLAAMAKPADASFEDINPTVAMPLMLMFYIGLIALIFSTVFWGMLHYKLWKLIPNGIARTTPGKAIGFMFIPLFNCYWAFVSCLGLSKDMNEAFRQRGLQYQVSEGLAQTFCILVIVSTLANLDPTGIIGTLLSVPGFIVAILFYKSVKDGAIVLLEQGQ